MCFSFLNTEDADEFSDIMEFALSQYKPRYEKSDVIVFDTYEIEPDVKCKSQLAAYALTHKLNYFDRKEYDMLCLHKIETGGLE